MNKDILDNDIFEGRKNIFSQTTGKVFGDVGFGMGLGMVMLSVAAMPYTFALLLPAAYVMFSRNGIKLDLAQNRIMEFTLHFGLFEKGKWRENSLYREIAIMGGTDSTAANFGIARAGTFSSSKIYIALLDKYHYKRLEIYVAPNLKDAREKAILISEKTGFPLVDFNPMRISQRAK